MEHTTTITQATQTIDRQQAAINLIRSCTESARNRGNTIMCRECNGLGVVAGPYDLETGHTDGIDCPRCYGMGDHIR